MHQRNSSASVSSTPSATVAVTLRSSSDSSLAMAHQDALDLEARDVLAPAPQVVGLAIDEEQVAVVVDPADVAGVVPPVPARRDGRLWPTPVALEHRVRPLRTNDDLALGPAGDLVVVVVE